MPLERRSVIHESSGEHLNGNAPKHLAGMFEVGGYFTMHIDERGKYRYLTPVMGMNDNDPKRISLLKEAYGGSIVPATKNSWVWRISGKKALAFAEQMEPFSPSNREDPGVS